MEVEVDASTGLADRLSSDLEKCNNHVHRVAPGASRIASQSLERQGPPGAGEQ